jgi:hypothetical protein
VRKNRPLVSAHPAVAAHAYSIVKRGLRLAAFCAVVAGMLLWELLLPRRLHSIGRTARWPSNIAVVVIDTVLVRLVFQPTVVGLAV